MRDLTTARLTVPVLALLGSLAPAWGEVRTAVPGATPAVAAEPAVPHAKPASAVAATPAVTAAEPAVSVAGTYLRVGDDEDRIGLEVAVREFVHRAGKGPRVALVAVAHIGEREFYEQLQEILDSYEVVLYESVLPPGARGPGGDDDLQRAESTRVAMMFVASLVERYRADRGRYPADLAALSAHLEAKDDRLAGWGRAASIDAWDRTLRYEQRGDDGFRLVSLGADGAPGGSGPDADLRVGSVDSVRPLQLDDSGNLQAELAATLGLAFQLEAVDYASPAWRCSDMAMDQVAAALADRGIEFQPLAGALTGSSLPAPLMSFLLRLVRIADAFMGGVIADTCKITLIEALGDDAVMERSLEQMGPGFSEVIVGMRNQVAVEDLTALMADEPDVGSVAIFYGAAHMPDLEQRIGALGYRPAKPSERDGAPVVRWLRAIEVDLAESPVSRADIDQIRAMMRQMR